MMEREIATYLASEFWTEVGQAELGYDKNAILLMMGFRISQRYPDATFSEVSRAFKLSLEMITGRRITH